MKNKNSKVKDVFLGILTAIGLWVFGHLMSGKLAFVEDITFLETGPLAFLFPFLFAFVLIKIAKYSVKSRKPIYFKATIISSFVPLICMPSMVLYNAFSMLLVSHSNAMIILNNICMIPFFLSVAPISIFFKMMECFGGDPQGFMLAILIILFAAPMLFGLIYSIKTFKKPKEKISETTAE